MTGWKKYFVDTHTFNALLQGRYDVIAGDKGTGKTALYKILMKRYRSSEPMRGIEIILPST
jgi:Cdc6-like AAA superfamily ATPase